MKRREVSKVDPYDNCRMWGDEKYSLQNMLLHQVNFPLYYYEGDTCWEVWSDRIEGDVHKQARNFLESVDGEKGYWEDRLRQLHPDNFLKYCAILVGKTDVIPTGARIVRYTHVMSGYPVFRYDVYWRHPDSPKEQLYTGNYGANINCLHVDNFYKDYDDYAYHTRY